MWDNNNLAQKNISIIYPDSSSDNAGLVVLGNQSKKNLKNLKLVILPEPRIKVSYFITFLDPKLNELFVSRVSKTIKEAVSDNLKRARGVWINTPDEISFEILNVGLAAMIIALGEQKTFNEGFELNIFQYSGEEISGSCGIAFRTIR